MNTDAMDWPEPAPSLARAVAAEFRLLREIGRGGMGVVFLAEDTRLLRHVAIKTLLPHLASDAQVRERFVRESRTAARLSHPSIVPIYAASEQQGVVYFVMGYVPGESLADRLARGGPLAVHESLQLVRQVADALVFAHEGGVVHRDIKAENVLVDQAGRAFITDFGIARMGDAQPLTATGTVLGSVYYMSPEQVTADPLDGRTDLYALGVLLFYLLSGRYPYERAQASAVLVAHVTSPVPSLRALRPEVPEAVEAMVQRLLAKSPQDRTPSARVLVQQIDDLLSERVASPNPAVLAHANPPVAAVALAGLSGIEGMVEGVVGSVPAAKADARPLSSAEAHQVWERAAALQAHTGAVVPPPAFRVRAPFDGEPLTRGYDAVVVKEAALEAGIDARYVDRALSEREHAQQLAQQPPGQSPATTDPMAMAVGDSQRRPPSVWFGAHRKLEFETALEGEIPLTFLEDMADEARRAAGELLNIDVVGRTLTMTSASRQRNGSMPRVMQVQVAVRNGRTIVRAFEDLTPIASGLFGGIGFGAGFGMAPLMFGVALKLAQDPVLATLAAVGGFLTAQGIARALFIRTARGRERTLRELVERLSALARGELANRKQLPP